MTADTTAALAEEQPIRDVGLYEAVTRMPVVARRADLRKLLAARKRFNAWRANPVAPPAPAEAADAVAEYLARGGKLTKLPPAYAAPTSAVAR